MNTQPKRILLTGGRGPAVLDFARALKKQGHHLVMAESSRMYFCRFSNAFKSHHFVPNPVEDPIAYIQSLIDIIEREKIEVLIPGYDEAILISKARGQFPKALVIFADDAKKIDTLTNKFTFMELLREYQINCTPTRLINTPDELVEVFDTNQHPRPAIVKSIYSAGGVQARTVRETTDVSQLAIQYPCIAQGFVPGRVWSTYSICHNGRMTFFVNYFPHFIYRENGAAICFEAKFHAGIFELVKELVEKSNYTGQVGFDIIEKPDGTLWPIECNPRITSGIHMARFVEGFDNAVLNDQSPLLTVPDGKLLQISRLSMIRILLHPSQQDFSTWMKNFIHAKDVLFDWRDPIPAITMPIIGLIFMQQYFKYKKTPEDNIFINKNWEV